MKKAHLLLAMLFTGLQSYGQVQITGDSIFVDSVFTAVYSMKITEYKEATIRVKNFGTSKFTNEVKRNVESHIAYNLKEQGFKGYDFYFEHTFDPFYTHQQANSSENKSDNSRTGILLRSAGRLYNAAIGTQAAGALFGGIALAAGAPIAAGVIATGASVITLFIVISGNTKLIEAGESIK